MNGVQLILSKVALSGLVLIFLSSCGLTHTEHLEREALISKGVEQHPSRCTRLDENLFEHHVYNNHLARTKIIKEPVYPETAEKLKVEGYVSLEFDLSGKGKPINISVLKSYPAGVFDQAGIDALSTWVYQGEMLTCLGVRLDFSLPPAR